VRAVARTIERGAVLTTLAVLALTLTGAIAHAAALSIDEPCSYPSPKVVKRAFGLPITATQPVEDIICYLDIGDAVDGAANRLAISQEFPGIEAFDTAREQFVDRRAIDNISGHDLVEVNGIGEDAYVNKTLGAFAVLVNKKFAFTLSWLPADGHAITDEEIASLRKVARNVVARAKK
jgi:hypothetical protein